MNTPAEIGLPREVSGGSDIWSDTGAAGSVARAAFFGSPEAPPVTPADPDFAYRTALLHLDGNKTDQVGGVWTDVASPSYSSTAPVFAGTQTLSVGGGNAIQSPAGLFNFGTDIWAVEVWLKGSDTTTDYQVVAGNNATGASNDGRLELYINPGGQLVIYSDIWGYEIGGGADIRDGDWRFYQALRDATGRFSVRLGKVGDATTTEVISLTIPAGEYGTGLVSTNPVQLGRDGSGDEYTFTGQLSDFRVTKGKAVSYAVPTAPFPNAVVEVPATALIAASIDAPPAAVAGLLKGKAAAVAAVTTPAAVIAGVLKSKATIGAAISALAATVAGSLTGRGGILAAIVASSTTAGSLSAKSSISAAIAAQPAAVAGSLALGNVAPVGLVAAIAAPAAIVFGSIATGSGLSAAQTAAPASVVGLLSGGAALSGAVQAQPGAVQALLSARPGVYTNQAASPATVAGSLSSAAKIGASIVAQTSELVGFFGAGALPSIIFADVQCEAALIASAMIARAQLSASITAGQAFAALRSPVQIRLAKDYLQVEPEQVMVVPK